MNDWPKQQIGRLALREQGNWWVAYYAQPSTMDEAIELARLHINIARQHPAAKDAFMLVMQMAAGELIREATGKTAEWTSPPEPAPGHERSGHA